MRRNNAPLPAGPAAMEGGGAYDRNAAVQSTTAAPAIAMLEQAAILVPVDAPSLSIVDYGAAAGRNSLAPLRAAISGLADDWSY